MGLNKHARELSQLSHNHPDRRAAEKALGAALISLKDSGVKIANGEDERMENLAGAIYKYIQECQVTLLEPTRDEIRPG